MIRKNDYQIFKKQISQNINRKKENIFEYTFEDKIINNIEINNLVKD